MEYASIYTVYQAAKFLADKNNQGILSIAELNTGVWDQLQRKVVSDIFNKINKLPFKKIAGRSNMFLESSEIDQLRDMIQPLEKTETLSGSNTTFALPSDFYKRQPDPILINGSIVCQISTKREIWSMIRTQMGKPTITHPQVAIEGSNVRVYPETSPGGTTDWVSSISMLYWKVPQGTTLAGAKTAQTPTYGSTTSSDGVETYNPVTTTNFELAKSAEPMLIDEFLLQSGINLRERDLIEAAVREQVVDQSQ